jgi:hypothetical protein
VGIATAVRGLASRHQPLRPAERAGVEGRDQGTARLLQAARQAAGADHARDRRHAHHLRRRRDARRAPRLRARLDKAHLNARGAGDYIALLDYFEESEENEAVIQQIRTHLRDATRCATTTGYGPRFLHSTGQLHKGGPASGVFIQLTAADARDVEIPGEPFTFSTLKQAQALGDFRSLSTRGRRAVRVELGPDTTAGLRRLYEIIREALPVSGATGASYNDERGTRNDEPKACRRRVFFL